MGHRGWEDKTGTPGSSDYKGGLSQGVRDPRARLWAGSSPGVFPYNIKTGLMFPSVGLSQDEKTRVLANKGTAFIDTVN